MHDRIRQKSAHPPEGPRHGAPCTPVPPPAITTREARDQLRLLEACVSHLNDIVLITEAAPLEQPGPRIVFVNPAFTRATGYSREEVIGRSPRFLQGPATQRSELDRIRAALIQARPVRAELTNYTKTGAEIWLEIDIVPVKNAAGAATHFVAVQREITARKLREAEARASEERYVRQRNSLITLTGIQPLDSDDVSTAFRRITEALARALGVARVGIWRYDEGRTEIRCEDLYELPSHRHSAGMVLRKAACPAYFDAIAEMDVITVDHALEDPLTREFSSTYLEPHGITSMIDAPVLLNGVIDGVLCSEHVGPPRRWTSDEKTFVAAVANVVSLTLEAGDRRRAEKAVREIEHRFEIVARATNDAVWDWNLDSGEIWWNEGFETLFGFRRTEIGRSAEAWYHHIHPDDARRVLPGIRRIIAGREENWSDEYRFQRADGTYAYVLDRGFVIRNADGTAVRMVGGMTDLTARKQAEQDLARLNRSLKMLSACNEALIRVTGRDQLLTEICRLAVDLGGFRMAWVGFARHDERRSIQPMASAGEDAGYLTEIQLTWNEDEPTGRGPAGRTIRSGEAVVCEDISADASFAPWRDAARRRGYRGVICLPLREEGKVFGLLGLYSHEVVQTAGDEMKLLQELADNLAFGLANIRARLEHQRTQDVVLKVAQAVSSGTGSEFFDLLTMNMVSALQGHAGVIGRVDPDQLSVTTLSFVLDGKLVDNVTYTLKGTPCESVRQGNPCVFPQGVQQLFPDDHLLVVYGIEAYAGIPLHDREGNVAGVLVVLFTEPMQEAELVQSTLQIFAARASAEIDRQASDARIREQASLLDRARDAILVHGLDHRLSYWNKSAERLYGWSAEEAADRSVASLIYRDTRDFQAAYDTVVATGEWVGEHPQAARDGREITVEGRWTLLRDPAGAPRSILAINTDITEHLKLKQQFLRAQRLESIGTLAGGIAHDLNNILTPISMAIELLRSEVTSEDGRELLATLAGSAKRGADMIGQVLSFARGVDGRRVEIQAGRLLAELGKIVRDTFPKNVIIEIDHPDGLPAIQGDPTQIHQVLLNLCVNSRDAMPGGGRIRIATASCMLDAGQAAKHPGAKPGLHLRFRVQDTGTGIAPAHLEKIFEPFFTTKELGKGTGLGLPTSLAIIKSHGGFIHAESAAGRGTRFDVYLPALSRPCLAPPQSAGGAGPRGNGETVLVVDDEPSIREITAKILGAFGYQVLLAASGAEAVELYRAHSSGIDVVITDMMMPGMDGTSTIKALARIDPDVRIIAASGITSYDARAREAGGCVRHFIPKPCSAGTLLKVLADVLSNASSPLPVSSVELPDPPAHT